MNGKTKLFFVLGIIMAFASIAATCTETDSGKNFYQGGTITLSDGTSFSDYCKNWSQSDWSGQSLYDKLEQRVVDYYCDNSLSQGWGSVEFTCLMTGSSSGLVRGCNNGACVAKEDMRKRGHWICYDKTLKEVGSETNCQSSSYYANLAHEDCKDKCNVNGTCGVKFVESWGLCGCSDSDGGIYPFKKGGTGELTDRCMTDGNVVANTFGTQVSETYCGEGITKTSLMDCPDGCVDGACIRLCYDTEFTDIVFWTERKGDGSILDSRIRKTTSWNYTSKGTASGATVDGQPMSGTDYCDQNNHGYITEYACNAYGQVENRYRRCSDMVPGTICHNGACILPSMIQQNGSQEDTDCVDDECINNPVNDSLPVEEELPQSGQNEVPHAETEPDVTLPIVENETALDEQVEANPPLPDEPQIIISQNIPTDEPPIHDLCPPDKYLICHKETNVLCVAESSIKAHFGHGDYEGQCVDEKADKKELQEIRSNEEVKVEFNNSIKISFRSLKERKGSNIAVTARVREVPPPDVPMPPRKVNNYLVIDHPDIENSDLADSKIEFTVLQDWLAGNNAKKEDIVLGKYVGTWQDLKTSYLKTEGNTLYFEADSLGFSTFAVTINNSVAPAVKQIPEELVQDAKENPITTENDEDSFTEKLLSWPFVFGTIILVFVLLTLRNLPPKEKKPEKIDPEMEKYNPVLTYIEKLKKNMSREEIAVELKSAGYDNLTIDKLLKISFNEKK